MRRALRAYRLSPIGGAVVLVLAAAILILAVGPKQDEVPAFVVIAVVVTLICVRLTPTWFGSAGGIAPATLEERREDLHPCEHDRDAGEPTSEDAGQDAAWLRERERYSRGE